MNYIYDILLNFQDEYYDFFEWNEDDQILHIKKVPIIKINDQDFNNIKNSTVNFDNNFLNKIYNKTQIFRKYDVNVASFICICCSDKETIGLKINKNGLIIGKSSLLLEESDEVLEIANILPYEKINFTIIKTSHNQEFQTRKQTLQSKKIIKNLNLLFKNKEFDKLNYLYFECFDRQEKNINKVFTEILGEIPKYNENYDKINDFLKLISQK